MKKILFGFIVIVMLSVGFAAALSPPPLPDKFYGAVMLDGANVSAGNQISITVGSVTDGIYNMTRDGYYELYVKKGNSAETISFHINGNLYGTRTRTGGLSENYDLSYTTPTSVIPPVSNPPSSGGGGGGSSSTDTTQKNTTTTNNTKNTAATDSVPCVPSWSCTEWSPCSNKTQSRTCTDKNGCNSTGIPETARDCVLLSPPGKNVSLSPKDTSASGTPTGLVTSGTAKSAGIAAIILIIAAAVLYVKRKK